MNQVAENKITFRKNEGRVTAVVKTKVFELVFVCSFYQDQVTGENICNDFSLARKFLVTFTALPLAVKIEFR